METPLTGMELSGIFSERLWFSNELVQCHSCPTSALTAARRKLSYVS